MTSTEIANIFKLPGEKRLAAFIDSVATTKQVYGLSDDEGWALLGDDNDADILPLFHDHELAEAFRKAADFKQYEVEMLEIDELIEWLGDLEEDDMMVAVCPNTRFEGAIVEPAQLKTDLLKKIENQ